jgi:transcriptional regulator with XRE-family HTH domain
MPSGMASRDLRGQMSTFAERLKALRRGAGLSQTELAGDGISPSYVSLLESGRRTPSPAVAALLAAKLGCSASELLDGELSERERRMQLELAYAELALRHDGSTDATTRLTTLLAEEGLPSGVRSQAEYLLARAQEQTGNLSAAITTLTALLDRARKGDRSVSVPRVAMFLCHCQKASGDLVRAVAIGEEALQACRAQGLDGTDEYFMLAASVMEAYGDLGDEAHAAAWARQLIEAAEAAGSRGGQAALYWNASLLAERDGRLDDALEYSRRAIAHLGELGDSRDLARLKVDSAAVLLAADPPFTREAHEILDRAQADLRRAGSELDVVAWEYTRSAVALLDGDLSAAEAFARAAIQRLPQDATSVHLSLGHQALGDALAAQGRRAEAKEHYALAADLRIAGMPGRGSALQWRDLAERFLASGEPDAALTAYRQALNAAGVRDRTRAVLAAIAGSRAESPADRRREPAGANFDETLTGTASVTDQL